MAYLVKKTMKYLKYIRVICEYVKKFSTLMFELPNMIEEDELLFNFMDNLQSWTK